MLVIDHDQRTNMHAILTLIIPAILNFIAVKYQGSSNSPFETHPIIMFLSIFTLLLYCFLSLPLVAHLPVFHTACGAHVFCFMTILSFSLSIALPMLLLFQGLSFFFLYLPLLILLSIAYVCGLVQKLILLVRQKIVEFLNLFAHRLLGGRAPPLLPLRVVDMHFMLQL
ncbi:hypothetical protein ACJRO7_028142 [Eucalyptus globulus]|uniref:Uncharacterized protein n=1 Tax=Eucalyptus globulus TaxID=34317 RepID=A0ABD3K6D0_EUCGL